MGIEIGDHVEAGEIAQDYDHGHVFERDGRLFVAWQLSQQATPAARAVLAAELAAE